MRRKDERLLINVIGRASQRFDDRVPCSALIVSNKVRNVLKDDELGPARFNDAHDLVEERPLGLLAHSLLGTALRKGLAWEAGEENVVFRN